MRCILICLAALSMAGCATTGAADTAKVGCCAQAKAEGKACQSCASPKGCCAKAQAEGKTCEGCAAKKAKMGCCAQAAASGKACTKCATKKAPADEGAL